MKDNLTRIGVFYDGNFFNVVSNYYAYHHKRRARISIRGLHEFVRKQVAEKEQTDARNCQVVDAHYFRGRFTAEQTNQAGKLLSERLFDDVLIREGITTHYLPMGHNGTEKGIDVWFALEAYELAIYKRFDVCVLIACDSDYLPLVRKLNTLGTRVMVLGWDFEYVDQHGRTRTTVTSQALLNEVSYDILISSLIEDKTKKDVVDQLFLPPRTHPVDTSQAHASHESANPAAPSTDPGETYQGIIQNIIERETENKRFGFITPEACPSAGGNNVFFGEHDLQDLSFRSLAKAMRVEFELSTNWNGLCAINVRRPAAGAGSSKPKG